MGPREQTPKHTVAERRAERGLGGGQGNICNMTGIETESVDAVMVNQVRTPRPTPTPPPPAPTRTRRLEGVAAPLRGAVALSGAAAVRR